MRKFLADTVAMITFSWVIGMVIEIGISGLTLGQYLQSRITGTIVNFLTGGLYGTFRDWLFKVTKTIPGHWVRETVVGIIAFVLFEVPLYVLILLSTGATISQIVFATGSITLVTAFIGGPYEWFLKQIRRLFGATSQI